MRALSGIEEGDCDASAASLQVAVPKDNSSRGSPAADNCVSGKNASAAAAEVKRTDRLVGGWAYCNCVPFCGPSSSNGLRLADIFVPRLRLRRRDGSSLMVGSEGDECFEVRPGELNECTTSSSRNIAANRWTVVATEKELLVIVPCITSNIA